MRAVIQRVNNAELKINNEMYSTIGKGLLVLLGIKADDNETDVNYIIDKIINIRIFKDDFDKMNLSVTDINGELMIVSQFTLYGDARKGRRPGFDMAAGGEVAKPIYDNFIDKLKLSFYPEKIKTGIFAAMMDINLTNSGPVTILLDSEKKF